MLCGRLVKNAAVGVLCGVVVKDRHHSVVVKTTHRFSADHILNDDDDEIHGNPKRNPDPEPVRVRRTGYVHWGSADDLVACKGAILHRDLLLLNVRSSPSPPNNSRPSAAIRMNEWRARRSTRLQPSPNSSSNLMFCPSQVFLYYLISKYNSSVLRSSEFNWTQCHLT